MKMEFRVLTPAGCVLAVFAAGPAPAAGGWSVAPFQARGVLQTSGLPGYQASDGVRLDDRRLADAAQRRDMGTVRALIDEGLDVDAPQADGATALAWAVHRDDLAMAELLLGAGARVNVANDLGVTPLMLASQNGSVPMVELLLQAGADPNAARPAGIRR